LAARRKNRPARRSPEEARKEILEAAVAFLLRHPFRDLTVEGLMASTSIGRSAFYAYFADRFDLAETLLVDIRSEVAETARPWLYEPGDDPVAALHVSLEHMVEAWRRIGPLLRALTDGARLDAQLERIYRNVVAYNDRAVADAIRRDQAAGWIGAALDADETAVALNQLNLAYLYDRLGHPTRRDIAPIVETLQEIWRRTLYPEARP